MKLTVAVCVANCFPALRQVVKMGGSSALTDGNFELVVCSLTNGAFLVSDCTPLDPATQSVAKFIIRSGVFELIDVEVVQSWAFSTKNSIVGLEIAVRDSSMLLEARGVIGIRAASTTTSRDVSKAKCMIQPLPGAPFAVTGQVDLIYEQGYTKVQAKIAGLVGQLSYGFHIHQFGDISSGSAVGPHFDVEPKSNHGLPGGAASVHIGDLGNVQFYDNAGFAWYNESFSTFKLIGDTNSVVGRALIVHSRMDNGCDQPTGGAGDKLAACVIGFAKSSDLTLPFAVPRQRGSVGCDLKNTPEASPTSTSFIWMTVLICLALVAIGCLFAYNWWRSRNGASNPTTVSGRQPWYVQQNEDEEDDSIA